MPRSVIFFLVLGGLFALTHTFATLTSLYWYYTWFDIIMHFWGGLLIVLGIRSLVRLGVPLTLNKRTVFSLAIFIMVTWEIFEYSIGLTRIAGHVFDVLKDILVGSAGVIIGYIVIRQRKN